MENINYISGAELALSIYGVSKEAGVGSFLLGHPGEFMKQLGNKTLTNPGGLMHQWYKPQGALDWGFNVVMPGMQMMHTMQNKQDPNRLSNALSIAGGALGGMAGFKPLGMLGGLGGSMLGSAAGRLAGHALKPLSQPRQGLPDPMFQ